MDNIRKKFSAIRKIQKNNFYTLLLKILKFVYLFFIEPKKNPYYFIYSTPKGLNYDYKKYSNRGSLSKE